MDEPYMFTRPTLFGMDSVTGNLKGAGEAGDEMMYGKNNLMKDIQQVVSTENSGVVQVLYECFDKLFEILGEYFPKFSDIKLLLDTGMLVAETVEEMDKQLGIIKKRKDSQ